MSADLALELEDVVFRYQEKGRRNILDHTSLTIPAGTLTVLMGGSGCGKSTLAAVAAGLYPENGGFLESGIIRLYGQDLKTLDPQKRAAYLTVLFQNPDLQFCMNTLREEMRFCLENICIPAGKMDERIEQAAAELGIVPLLDQPLSTLSGGEKQRIAIARMMLKNAPIVILDEATAMLDPRGREQVMQTIHHLNKDLGITVVSITHYMEEAAQADRVLVMSQGNVVMEGTPKEVFSQTEKVRSLRLDVPQAAELRDELVKAGIPMPEGIIDTGECAQALYELLK